MMLDFTPDFVEMLEAVGSATSHTTSCVYTKRQCIRSLTCEPHEENRVAWFSYFRKKVGHHVHIIRSALYVSRDVRLHMREAMTYVVERQIQTKTGRLYRRSHSQVDQVVKLPTTLVVLRISTLRTEPFEG